MLKKPHYIALGLVGLLTLIVLSLPQHTASQIKLAIGGLFLPLFGLSKSSQQLAREAGNAVVPALRVDPPERTPPPDQRGAVGFTPCRQNAVFRENEQLRQLLNWRQEPPQSLWNLKLARVVGHDPANWWHTLQIDLGSRDGMQTNLTVLVPEGFVGRISAVGLTTSQVTLIGNPELQSFRAVESGQDARTGHHHRRRRPA